MQRVAPGGEWTVAGAHQSGTEEREGSIRKSNCQLGHGQEDEQLGQVEGRHVLADGRLEG